jgi:hypothetical protein
MPFCWCFSDQQQTGPESRQKIITSLVFKSPCYWGFLDILYCEKQSKIFLFFLTDVEIQTTGSNLSADLERNHILHLKKGK